MQWSITHFLDVDLDTMGLSPNAVFRFLEEFGDSRDEGCFNKKTRNNISACLPIHTFGFPGHLDELKAVCDTWKIPIVEDAAEYLGSEYKNQPTGSIGEIVTNNEQLGMKGKYLTTTAKVPHSHEFFHD
jgi:perosamine synthetase